MIERKCIMSVCIPNSESHFKVFGKLEVMSNDSIMFDQNRVWRNIFVRGAWKHGVMKVIQSWIGSLKKK